MKHLIKKIIKEQSEGLSKIELAVFNRLKSRKISPNIYSLKTFYAPNTGVEKMFD